MRIPIILALLVVITLPKDVHALATDVGTHLRSATATVASLFVHDDGTIQVADTAKNSVSNLR